MERALSNKRQNRNKNKRIVKVEEEQQGYSRATCSASGSSSEKEEPVPPERSSEKEESGEKEADIQHDDRAPEEKTCHKDVTMIKTSLETKMIQFFAKLKKCFSDDYHGEWAGFYNPGVSSFFETPTHVLACEVQEVTMAPHERLLVPSSQMIS